jgi:hypothetical protein
VGEEEGGGEALPPPRRRSRAVEEEGEGRRRGERGAERVAPRPPTPATAAADAEEDEVEDDEDADADDDDDDADDEDTLIVGLLFGKEPPPRPPAASGLGGFSAPPTPPPKLPMAGTPALAAENPRLRASLALSASASPPPPPPLLLPLPIASPPSPRDVFNPTGDCSPGVLPGFENDGREVRGVLPDALLPLLPLAPPIDMTKDETADPRPPMDDAERRAVRDEDRGAVLDCKEGACSELERLPKELFSSRLDPRVDDEVRDTAELGFELGAEEESFANKSLPARLWRPYMLQQ